MSPSWHVLKWGWLALALTSLGVMLGFLWRDGISFPPMLHMDDDGALTSITRPLIVERDGARIVWRLHAELAEQRDAGMQLRWPRLELFTESGEVVTIRARYAYFDPGGRNLDFRSHVWVQYRDWHVQTERLRYLGRQDVIVIPGHFRATSHEATVSGRQMRAERKTQRLFIAHDVHVRDLRYDARPTHGDAR